MFLLSFYFLMEFHIFISITMKLGHSYQLLLRILFINSFVCLCVEVPKPRSWNRGPETGVYSLVIMGRRQCCWKSSSSRRTWSWTGVYSLVIMGRRRCFRRAGLFRRSFDRNEVQCPSVTFFFSPFYGGLAFSGVVSTETRSSVRPWRFFFFFALFRRAGLFRCSFDKNEAGHWSRRRVPSGPWHSFFQPPIFPIAIFADRPCAEFSRQLQLLYITHEDI
jgi:hypothetical protein